jgi:hypothetical protein
MDPIALILAALKTGAFFVGETMASEAVKDSYGKLKSLLASRVKSSDDAHTLLQPRVLASDLWLAKATEILERIDAKNDNQLTAAAQTFLTQLNQTQTSSGKFNLQANSINTVIQGDYSHIVLERPPKSDRRD